MGAFTSTYLYLLNSSRKTNNDILKVGAAGSVTMLVSEGTFYAIDAVNAWSKMLTVNVGFTDMI